MEWSLKTWLAPWACLASVAYHDLYWYPKNGKTNVHDVLKSDWGRLFHNWGAVESDENGFTSLGDPPSAVRKTLDLLKTGVGVFGTAAKEAPEVRNIFGRGKQFGWKCPPGLSPANRSGHSRYACQLKQCPSLQ